ncbi:hypothetical protein IWX90DRAFT_420351 [Phyllosticta citrichinensis]|uniref:Uncharacterized protein n=1 Tax=Phyllosticta citrichinensis TaxID=1130410 RepID=A0ABR1Y5K7_9PEZI
MPSPPAPPPGEGHRCPCRGGTYQDMYSRTFHKRVGGNSEHVSEHFYRHRSSRDDTCCHRKCARRTSRHREDSRRDLPPVPGNDQTPPEENRDTRPRQSGGEAQPEQPDPGTVARVNPEGRPAPEEPNRDGPAEVPQSRLLDTMERLESLCQRVADRLDSRPEHCCDRFDHDFGSLSWPESPWHDFDDCFDWPDMVGPFFPCSMDGCGSPRRRSSYWSSCRREFTETRRIGRG